MNGPATCASKGFAVGGRRLSLLLTGLLLLAIGCGGQDPLEKTLLGAWSAKRPHQEFILIFIEGQRWEYRVRTGSRPAAPAGTLAGSWTAAGRRLSLCIEEGPGGAAWPAGQVLAFTIADLTPGRLVLTKEDGERVEYLRVPETGPEASGRALSFRLPPMAVNLPKVLDGEPDRFLCLTLSLAGAEAAVLESVHPKAIETILFYLSAKPYEDLNTFAKLNRLEPELLRIIRPFLQDTVSAVQVEDAFVTTDPARVEAFLATDAAQTGRTFFAKEET